MIGNITGREIGKYKDGDVNRVLLQVQFFDDDTKQVELISQHGEDINPANGCRVIVIDITESYQAAIAITDDLPPEVDAGEKEIYSTDSPATTKKARTKWDKDGNIIMNVGTNHAVQHEALQTAINTFLVALNGQLVGLGGAGGLTLDITPAQIATVKVP